MDLGNCIKGTLCDLNWSNNPSYELQLIGWSILFFYWNLMGQLCCCRFTLNNTTIFFAPCFNMSICFCYPGGFISKRLSETLSFSRKNVRKGLYLLFFINSLILSLIQLFIHLFSDSFTHCFIDSMIDSFIQWFINALIHGLYFSFYLFIYLFIIYDSGQ